MIAAKNSVTVKCKVTYTSNVKMELKLENQEHTDEDG